jgi:quercetin dioxygenase-like cupin family protein
MNTYRPLTTAASAAAAHPDRPATAIMHDEPGARLVVFRIAAGQHVAPHTNSSTVVLCVVDGSGFVSGDGREVSVYAGDVVTFAPRERHGMRAEAHPMVVLAVIAPRPH